MCWHEHAYRDTCLDYFGLLASHWHCFRYLLAKHVCLQLIRCIFSLVWCVLQTFNIAIILNICQCLKLMLQPRQLMLKWIFLHYSWWPFYQVLNIIFVSTNSLSNPVLYYSFAHQMKLDFHKTNVQCIITRTSKHLLGTFVLWHWCCFPNPWCVTQRKVITCNRHPIPILFVYEQVCFVIFLLCLLPTSPYPSISSPLPKCCPHESGIP